MKNIIALIALITLSLIPITSNAGDIHGRRTGSNLLLLPKVFRQVEFVFEGDKRAKISITSANVVTCTLVDMDGDKVAQAKKEVGDSCTFDFVPDKTKVYELQMMSERLGTFSYYSN